MGAKNNLAKFFTDGLFGWLRLGPKTTDHFWMVCDHRSIDLLFWVDIQENLVVSGLFNHWPKCGYLVWCFAQGNSGYL